MICSYAVTDERDTRGRAIFACTNRGCGNRMACESETQIRPSMCKGPECIHLGEPTDEIVTCKGCKGSPAEHAIWTCAVKGTCLPTVRKSKPTIPAVHRCDGCQERA